MHGGKGRTTKMSAYCGVALLAAQLWDGPASKALAVIEFARVRLAGEKPRLGENRKVTVRMRGQRAKRKPAMRRRHAARGCAILVISGYRKGQSGMITTASTSAAVAPRSAGARH